MFCEVCGAELSDHAQFCSQCGKRLDDSSASPESVPAQKRMPWTALFGVVVVAVVVAGAVLMYASQQSQAKASRLAAATKAVEAVGEVNAAVGIGVNFEDYSTKLLDAAAAVEAYQPEDETGTAIKASLAKALLYYQCAREVWQDDIRSGFNFYAADAPVVVELQEKYPELSLPDSGDADTVRQAAWVISDEAYVTAKEAAASYQ